MELEGAELDLAVAEIVNFPACKWQNYAVADRTVFHEHNIYLGTYVRQDGYKHPSWLQKLRKQQGDLIIGKSHWIFSPSTNWSQCGPLIEEYGIGLMEFKYRDGISCEPYWLGMWTHSIDSSHYKRSEEGPTPLIAACRALLAAKPLDE